MPSSKQTQRDRQATIKSSRRLPLTNNQSKASKQLSLKPHLMGPTSNSLLAATDWLVEHLAPLTFDAPITHTYNPLIYAREPWNDYVKQFANTKKKVVFLGMNPGPYGMAQTGIPFGEISAVRDWMKLTGSIDHPNLEHPKRLISGFACKRSEVSGRRLWGWAQEYFKTPESFFEHAFVLNYCPLVFMEASGRNFTPDKLPPKVRHTLYDICDHALDQMVQALAPEWVIGVGNFAAERASQALKDTPFKIGKILHPSPASPQANKGWSQIAHNQLAALGVTFN